MTLVDEAIVIEKYLIQTEKHGDQLQKICDNIIQSSVTINTFKEKTHYRVFRI